MYRGMYCSEDGSTMFSTALPLSIGGLHLCDLGFQRTPPSFTFGPAVRDYTLLHFVLSGKGTYVADGQTFALQAGECFCIRPDRVTVYGADADDPWTYAWIGLRGAEGAQLVTDAFGDRLTAGFDLRFVPALEALYADGTDGFALGLRAVGLLLEVLSTVYETNDCFDRRKPDVVNDAVRFIQANYIHPFDITTLAYRLGVSRAHFTTVFGAAMGISPYRYLPDGRGDGVLGGILGHRALFRNVQKAVRCVAAALPRRPCPSGSSAFSIA